MLIGDSVYKLNMLMPFPNGNSILFFAEFEKDTSNYSLFTQIPKKSFKSDKSFNFGLFNGSLMSNTLDTVLQGKALITFKELSDNEIKGVGKILLSGKSDSLNISFSGNEAISGMGNSKLSIEKDSAYLSGDLGTITYFQIKNLIQQHPEIKTLVLTDISGSINDAVNMHTGRIVREAGLNTYVPSNGSIASGGVDLFCAGVQRTISNGAKVGVHSWCCINDLTASELPKTHPAHKAQLDYFTLLMGPIDGPAFYFYTLTAASFEDVHWMSNNEMIEYKIITNTIK